MFRGPKLDCEGRKEVLTTCFGILLLFARTGKLCCSTCLAGGPSNVGFSHWAQCPGTMTCRSAMEQISDHKVKSLLLLVVVVLMSSRLRPNIKLWPLNLRHLCLVFSSCLGNSSSSLLESSSWQLQYV